METVKEDEELTELAGLNHSEYQTKSDFKQE